MSDPAEADGGVHWDEMAVWEPAIDTGRRKRINSNDVGIVMYLPIIKAFDILAEATEEAQ